MLRVAIVFLALVALATATPFNNCKNGPAPEWVDVKGCDSLPCQFVSGQYVVADIAFKIDRTVSVLNTKMMATALGVTTEFPLPDLNGCNGLTNSECPLANGDEVIYHLETLLIPLIYPKVRADLEFSFVDQNNQVVVCFKISGKVVDA